VVHLLMRVRACVRVYAWWFPLAVCLAMHALHTANPPLVHGGIKLSNCLLNASGTIKFANFGLRLIEREVLEATRSVNAEHLPYSYAPEVLRHDLTRLEALSSQSVELFESIPPLTDKADVYSLGVILCELYTMQRPAQLKGITTMGSFVNKVCSSSLSLIPANLPAELHDLVALCLEPKVR